MPSKALGTMLRSSLTWYCRTHSPVALALRKPDVVSLSNRPLGLTTLVVSSPGHVAHVRTVHQTTKNIEPNSRKPSPPLAPDAAAALLNPPASTRPPTLEVQPRSAFNSVPSYLFGTAKSYLRFYKDGLKSIFANWRLLRTRVDALGSNEQLSFLWPGRAPPRAFSRADWVLFWRVRHDVLRLPLFGLIFLVFGELSPLIVVYVHGAVPYTCRTPQQLCTAAEKTEQRRRDAFDQFETTYPGGVSRADAGLMLPSLPGEGSPKRVGGDAGNVVSPGVARRHVLRTLNLSGAMWDTLGFVPPGMWLLKGALRMHFLEHDDEKLLAAGGPMGLVADELRIACMERGIDVLGRSESDMRTSLGDWLRLTAAEDVTVRRRRMTTLLITRYV